MFDTGGTLIMMPSSSAASPFSRYCGKGEIFRSSSKSRKRHYIDP
jgi:hypothetical protein